tara:strand:+ start:181588 stop:182022 length:435 start_codon:yes stop_codon:yes gene_type:complete
MFDNLDHAVPNNQATPSKNQILKIIVCEHLLYVADRYSIKTGLHNAIVQGSKSIHGTDSISLRQLTAILVNVLKNIEPERINGDLSMKGITLAIWYGDNVACENGLTKLKADALSRMLIDRALSKRRTIALAKLTNADKEVLGL